MTSARKNLIDPAGTPYYHCMALRSGLSFGQKLRTSQAVGGG